MQVLQVQDGMAAAILSSINGSQALGLLTDVDQAERRTGLKNSLEALKAARQEIAACA